MNTKMAIVGLGLAIVGGLEAAPLRPSYNTKEICEKAMDRSHRLDQVDQLAKGLEPVFTKPIALDQKTLPKVVRDYLKSSEGAEMRKKIEEGKLSFVDLQKVEFGYPGGWISRSIVGMEFQKNPDGSLSMYPNWIPEWKQNVDLLKSSIRMSQEPLAVFPAGSWHKDFFKSYRSKRWKITAPSAVLSLAPKSFDADEKYNKLGPSLSLGRIWGDSLDDMRLKKADLLALHVPTHQPAVLAQSLALALDLPCLDFASRGIKGELNETSAKDPYVNDGVPPPSRWKLEWDIAKACAAKDPGAQLANYRETQQEAVKYFNTWASFDPKTMPETVKGYLQDMIKDKENSIPWYKRRADEERAAGKDPGYFEHAVTGYEELIRHWQHNELPAAMSQHFHQNNAKSIHDKPGNWDKVGLEPELALEFRKAQDGWVNVYPRWMNTDVTKPGASRVLNRATVDPLFSVPAAAVPAGFFDRKPVSTRAAANRVEDLVGDGFHTPAYEPTINEIYSEGPNSTIVRSGNRQLAEAAVLALDLPCFDKGIARGVAHSSGADAGSNDGH